MRVLITGVCGFVGSSCAIALRELTGNLTILGIDSLVRPGSETNRQRLIRLGVKLIHGDVRMQSDLDGLPAVDFVIDGAANPSVLAGVDGKSSPRQLIEHNLFGTVELLEYCRKHSAGLILLSTSRVYSAGILADLPLKESGRRLELDASKPLPAGLSERGLNPLFSTKPPISLYGATKLASETLAAEYAGIFKLPLWINRCGVLAGAGQFGTPSQGIVAYWIHSHLRRRPLRFLGFGGTGFQVRDALHPMDLAKLLLVQMKRGTAGCDPGTVHHAGGGMENSFSLAELHAWCDDRFGQHPVEVDPSNRQFDIPWLVMDSDCTWSHFGVESRTPLDAILDEIAVHAESNPDWLETSGSQ